MTTLTLTSLPLSSVLLVVEQLPVPVLVVDDDGVVVAASQAARVTLDARDDLIGRALDHVVDAAPAHVRAGERSTVTSEAGDHHLVAIDAAAPPPKDVAALAGAVAHDFNNLLGVIMNFTSLAAATIPAGSAAAADLREVLAASQRAATIAHRLQELGAPRGRAEGR